MKQAELKKCAICNLGVMHSGCPIFYRVSLSRLCVDVNAVQRRHGLELMLGSPVLAGVMGTDEDIAKEMDSGDFLLCQDCVMRPMALVQLTEKTEDSEATS